MALSLIPGAAHIDLGRTTQGLLYFLLFAFCLNGALIAPFLSSDPELRIRCGWGAAAFWLVAFVDALRIAGYLKKPIRAGGDSFSVTGRRSTDHPAERPR